MPGLSFYDDLSSLPRETRALVEQLIEEMRVERTADEQQPGEAAVSPRPGLITEPTHRRLAS